MTTLCQVPYASKPNIVTNFVLTLKVSKTLNTLILSLSIVMPHSIIVLKVFFFFFFSVGENVADGKVDIQKFVINKV